jgi:6-phosphofructokinase
VIDKSFGIDTAVEEAQRATNAAHVEVESEENGVGIVKLMGRYSGKLFEHSLIDGTLMAIRFSLYLFFPSCFLAL